jgi:hypothetical protein
VKKKTAYDYAVALMRLQNLLARPCEDEDDYVYEFSGDQLMARTDSILRAIDRIADKLRAVEMPLACGDTEQIYRDEMSVRYWVTHVPEKHDPVEVRGPSGEIYSCKTQPEAVDLARRLSRAYALGAQE